MAYLARAPHRAPDRQTHPDPGGRRLLRSRAARGSRASTTWEPVVTGHILHRLPRWYAYLLGVAPTPAVVRFEPGYRRTHRELRRMNRNPHPTLVTRNPAPPAPQLRDGRQHSARMPRE